MSNIALDVKTDSSTKKIVHGAEEKVICSVDSSQSCNHTWKWFDEIHEEIVANGSALVTHKPGWYQCESECNIRGKRCTVLSKLFHVSGHQSKNAINVRNCVSDGLRISVGPCAEYTVYCTGSP